MATDQSSKIVKMLSTGALHTLPSSPHYPDSCLGGRGGETVENHEKPQSGQLVSQPRYKLSTSQIQL
jgi:hypothetical protein